MENQVFGRFQPFDQGPGTGLGGVDVSWAVPWSDLMMVMFVLFVVLFVYKSVHKDVTLVVNPQAGFSEQAPAQVDPLAALIGRISAHGKVTNGFNMPMGASGVEPLFRSEDGAVTVTRDAENRIRLTLRGAGAFNAGSGELNPQAAAYLDEAARLLKVNAGAIHVQGFAADEEIAGVAETIGTSGSDGMSGFRLSARRAAAVAEYFIVRHGLDADRFIITGRGIHHPESVPGTENGAERNRRVEIVILPGATS